MLYFKLLDWISLRRIVSSYFLPIEFGILSIILNKQSFNVKILTIYNIRAFAK